jgi:mRNA interferase RelE/StbE
LNPSRRHDVLWTETALRMLEAVGDRRIQQLLFDTSKRLESDPEKQGKPLRDELLGYRSLRVIGQRHRLIFSIDTLEGTVHVVAAGIRREGSRNDVYLLAQKLVRLGLAPSPRPRKISARRLEPKKKRK